MITSSALDYKIGQPIQRMTYTDNEKGVWKLCYNKLSELFKTNACKEFNWTIKEFEKEIGFKDSEIP